MEAQRRRQLVAWVAREVMPHEPAVRAWLSGRMVGEADADDLVQEAYCRMSALESFDQIDRPDGYFFQTVRNLMLSRVRRQRVVRIDSVAELAGLAGADDRPSPEGVAGDRREYERVRKLVDLLPERCRKIFEMRRMEGMSQREIAARFGISEMVVENESSRGLRLIVEGLREQGTEIARHYEQRGRRRRRP